MHDLKSELEGYSSEEYDENHKVKALTALKRMDNWNLFSDTNEVNVNGILLMQVKVICSFFLEENSYQNKQPYLQ